MEAVQVLGGPHRVLVGQHTGVWPEGVEAWMLDVKVFSDKGETYRSRLKVK